jgi:putative transposase
MGHPSEPALHQRWAHFRFSVIGRLLAAPPERGELEAELHKLAQKTWKHPVSGQAVRFGFSTLERWYYEARNAGADPVGALQKRARKDLGQQSSLTQEHKQQLRAQYAAHRSWSYQLHFDNLQALAKADPKLSAVPSYPTVRRYMKAAGLFKRQRLSSQQSAGELRAERRLEEREVRSYEAQYVRGLWHTDFHHGSRKVLTAQGRWATPLLLGVIDDRSRLVCHAQWYLAETAENVVHGLSQAIQKRGLPRSLMSDNGSAFLAEEVTQGLMRLGVLHETTLPHSPYQNGKQESFWGQVEGRLLAMLELKHDLTLSVLNEATQAWLELEYNRERHSELGQAPLARWLEGPDVSRPSPSSQHLRLCFMAEQQRTQRRSDGTVSIEGRRFEVPSRYRHLERLTVRYARWSLEQVHLVDGATGTLLCPLLPLDKVLNANGLRRSLQPLDGPPTPQATAPQPQIAPLLQNLMAEYARTGLPPAYLPKDELVSRHEDGHEQEAAVALRPEVEPLLSAGAHRGAARQPEAGALPVAGGEPRS